MRNKKNKYMYEGNWLMVKLINELKEMALDKINNTWEEVVAIKYWEKWHSLITKILVMTLITQKVIMRQRSKLKKKLHIKNIGETQCR